MAEQAIHEMTGQATYEEVRQALLDRREIALIDVREEGPFAEAHPLFAASLPLGRLETELLERVPRLDTRLVFYDAGEGWAALAAARARGFGYTRAAVLTGGLEGWRAAGGELFRDVNVPSKAFGELVEAHRHTPSLAAHEVHALIDSGANIAILDARRFEEYRTMSIPTATSVPGAELVYRVGELAPDPSTLVIVNCAGRTRSIIGTQSLINAGIPNPVRALRNGTIGWVLAGLTLDRGRERRAPEVGPDAAAGAARRARRVADRAGVVRVDWPAFVRLRDDAARTTYAFDVRTPDEYAAGHLPGFASAPGGQLVQETDVFAPVRGARIVVWDPAGPRADMTASWLAQMGWDVSVLDGVGTAQAAEGGEGPRRRVPPPPVSTVGIDEAQRRLEAGEAVAIDVAPSPEYLRAHVPGAWLLSRTRLAAAVGALPSAAAFIVTSTDGLAAAYAAPEIAAATGRSTVVLEGGTAAWRGAGLPLSTGPEHLTLEPTDVYKRPYEGTDNPVAAMEGYLQWEYGLVEQLARDGTHGFHVLDS